MRLALVAALLVIAPAAVAQTQLSDFAGIWESAGSRMGPGGPAGSPPGARRNNTDGSATFGLGAPPPQARGNRAGISEADAALGLEMGDIRVRNMMTPAGKARFAQFKPSDHPMFNCISPGLPTVMGMPGLQDWAVTGNELTFRQETWTEPRTISLSGQPAPNAVHSRQGQASAELKDGALVITTTNLTEAWGGLARNAPGSAERTVVETYRLADANTIRGIIEITDPLFLAQPLRIPVLLRRAPNNLSFESFPCELESSRIALPQ
jgi:hypothetical protein